MLFGFFLFSAFFYDNVFAIGCMFLYPLECNKTNLENATRLQQGKTQIGFSYIRTPLVKVYHVEKFRRGKMSCSVGKYKFTVGHLESALTFLWRYFEQDPKCTARLRYVTFPLIWTTAKGQTLPKGKVVSFSKYKYAADLHLRKLWTCLRHCQQKKNVQKGSINLKKNTSCKPPVLAILYILVRVYFTVNKFLLNKKNNASEDWPPWQLQ